MDQKEATDYILKSIEQGKTRIEIVDYLCKSLNAPSQAIGIFYDRVIGQQQKVDHQSSTHTEQARDGPDSVQKADEADGGITSNAAEIDEPESDINAEIDAFIMQQLTRHRLVKDVVLDVCQRTGWKWDEAQKYIADFQSSNLSELTRKEGGLSLFIGALFVIVGITITLISTSELVNLLIPDFNLFLPILSLPITAVPYLFGGLASGIGLAAGGIYGIWNSLANHE